MYCPWYYIISFTSNDILTTKNWTFVVQDSLSLKNLGNLEIPGWEIFLEERDFFFEILILQIRYFGLIDLRFFKNHYVWTIILANLWYRSHKN